MARKKKKLLYIGFDAMDYMMIHTLADKLPHITEMCNYGSFGRCIPEYKCTGPSWTTLATGLLKENHKILDAWGRRRGTSRCFADLDPELLVWNIVAAEYRVGSYSLPVTYPPSAPPNGWMVSGFPTPKSSKNTISDPSKIQEKYLLDYQVDIVQQNSENRRNLDFPQPDKIWIKQVQEWGLEKFYRINDQIESKRMAALKNILKAYPVDVLFVGFTFLDRLGHLFDLNKETATEAYEYCDKLVKDLCRLFPAEITVIVSDHGFRNDDHTDDGVFIISGDGITPGYDFTCYNTDVMPTALCLLNMDDHIPVVDGNIVREVKYKNFVADTEKQDIENQLRAIGYI